MILKLKLQSCFLLECSNELRTDNDIGDIALLKDNAVERELPVELFHHGGGHVGLQVEHLVQPDAVDEVPHVLFNLSSEQLIKSSCA